MHLRSKKKLMLIVKSSIFSFLPQYAAHIGIKLFLRKSHWHSAWMIAPRAPQSSVVVATSHANKIFANFIVPSIPSTKHAPRRSGTLKKPQQNHTYIQRARNHFTDFQLILMCLWGFFFYFPAAPTKHI